MSLVPFASGSPAPPVRPDMRVDVGPVAEISDRRCVAVAGGAAVVVRVADRICAYRNRCAHQDSPLDGGWVRDGVLSCPLHFWRYRVDDGRHLGSSAELESMVVEIEDGHAYVLVPDEPPTTSLREQLLARARAYDRDEQYARDVGRRRE